MFWHNCLMLKSKEAMNNKLNWSILGLVSKGKFFNLPEQDFLDTACLYSKITSEIFINYFVSYVQYTEKHFQSSSSILKTQCFLLVTDKVMLNHSEVLRLNQIYLFLTLKLQQVSYYWCSTKWLWSFHNNSDSIFSFSFYSIHFHLQLKELPYFSINPL